MGTEMAEARMAEMELGKRETLTPKLVEEFLEDLGRRGRSPASLQEYRRSLMALYSRLPDGKILTAATGREWKGFLEMQGLGPRTVNARMSVWNSLMQYMGHRDWQVGEFSRVRDDVQPELTRAEYLRLLGAAKQLDQGKAYILIKTLGGVGLRTQELPQLTADAVRRGTVRLESRNGMRSRILHLPGVLQKELLDYMDREGINEGPVFATSGGKSLDRSNVWQCIKKVSRDARVPEEKANPRCLWKMYQSTREGIEANIAVLVEQAYERLLEQEQLAVGWEAYEKGV